MSAWIVILSLFVYSAALCQPAKTKQATPVRDSSYTYKEPSSGGTGKFYFGREISQVMDASGADWLERTSRPQQENTDKIVASLNLQPQSVVADVGAGTGYYTFRIAPLVPEGRVYAVEIQDELIETLVKRKSDSGAHNVEVIRGDTQRVNLPANTLDMALLVDVYHELSWPREIIQSIRESLKPDGKIILVEYRGEDPSIRIKPLHKTTIAQLTKEMGAHGFKLERRVDDLPIQHFLVFGKK